MRLNYILCCGLFVVIAACSDQDTSFHPNGIAVGGIGAVVCPDSAHARAGLSDKAWSETLEDSEKKVQAGEQLRAPDLTGDNCSTVVPGTPVYIESTDSSKLATVTAKLPDGTTIHGITRSDMVQENK
jgi:hypothetical protein